MKKATTRKMTQPFDRDAAANAALMGLLSDHGTSTHTKGWSDDYDEFAKEVAERAYEYADAMALARVRITEVN